CTSRSSSPTRRRGWRSPSRRCRGGRWSRSTRWWRSLPDTELPDVRRAARAGAGVVRETPVVSSRTLSERVGGTVALKAENLQRTGSFKLRGALAKLDALGEAGCRGGVVCASAGNHAQARAYAAKERGHPCRVFVTRDAPVAQ